MDKIFAPIKKRIINYIDYKGITKENFYNESELSASNFKGKGAGSELGGEKIAKILTLYDDLNADWLLTGNGKMLKQQKSQLINKEESVQEETRPRIPMDAAAGSLIIAPDGITIDDCEQYPIIKAFPRYDFTIFARGDSMETEYHSGDELACLFIKNSSFVQWGRCHVLDTTQGIIVKRIFDAKEFILCKSDNPNYKDFSIHKSEVYNLALVIGMIRRY